MKPCWTLATLCALGGTAFADFASKPGIDAAETLTVQGGSPRGVAEDYLVLPSGGELGAQMRFVTSKSLEFTDLALFGLSARYSIFEKLEISANVDLLPKQPSDSHEKPWQSVGGGLRSPLGRHVALAVSGAGGHLMAHEGMWTREAMTLEWKKPIHDVLAFDPQPRLDFHAGTVLSLVKEWDLYADFSVIDRGDLANPATRLPILDGGFDQKQIVFGMIRHIEGKRPPPSYDGDSIELSQR
jgi:hypothetical protein